MEPFPMPPPAIFNSRPELIRSSIARALTLDLEGVIPNHCDTAPFSEHLKRLRLLNERLGCQRIMESEYE